MKFHNCHGDYTWIKGISKTGRGNQKEKYSITLEAVKLEKLFRLGDNMYLKYNIWYTELFELVMKWNA